MTGAHSILAGRGWDISLVGETGSTNDDLLRAAREGALADRTVLRTDYQTRGRGRMDRRWDAPPGSNLLASMYLASGASIAGELMHRVGLAIVEGVEALAGENASIVSAARLGLKWPNDVLLDGRKLAGVLAQGSSDIDGVVIGFGVNVGWAPPDASRVDDVVACTPATLLDAVLAAFDILPVDIHDRYVARLDTIGRHVRVELPSGGELLGTAIDVDSNGRLVVLDRSGGVTVLDIGDVVHLRRVE